MNLLLCASSQLIASSAEIAVWHSARSPLFILLLSLAHTCTRFNVLFSLTHIMPIRYHERKGLLYIGSGHHSNTIAVTWILHTVLPMWA